MNPCDLGFSFFFFFLRFLITDSTMKLNICFGYRFLPGSILRDFLFPGTYSFLLDLLIVLLEVFIIVSGDLCNFVGLVVKSPLSFPFVLS